MDFYVVDVQSVYNAILGTSAQAVFDAVTSVPHQRVKFPTQKGIGVEFSNSKGVLDYLVKYRKANPETEPTQSQVAMMCKVEHTSTSVEILEGGMDHQKVTRV